MSLVLVGTGVDPTLVLHWLTGSLDLRTWAQWNLLWPIALALLPLLVVAPAFANLAQLGDEATTSLGARASLVRLYLLGLSVALAAAAVAVAGPIAFVGLIAPQLARTLVGGDARRLLPTAALIGSILVVVADLVARTITLQDIPFLSHLVHQGSAVGNVPVGVYLALLGAPLFFVLVLRSERS
jgi:iron complex transport system permease protein